MGNCFSSTRGLKKDHISLNPQPSALQIHEPAQILPQQDPIQIHTPLIHPGPLPRPVLQMLIRASRVLKIDEESKALRLPSNHRIQKSAFPFSNPGQSWVQPLRLRSYRAAQR